MEQQRRLPFQPYTQWESGVRFSASACGAAAIAGMIGFWERNWIAQQGQPYESLPADPAEAINAMYRAGLGTPIGMAAPMLAYALRNQLNQRLRESGLPGKAVTSRFKKFESYRAEIDAGRLVAVKFDKWFSFRWFGHKPIFDYHWTVGCGYRIDANGTRFLRVHDAGGRRADGTWVHSREREIEYEKHRGVLTMIGLKLFDEYKKPLP
ncbi:hypothetical protein [Saccharibacillus sp. JS10]|uniref:hypothetical protein n=1 Tax=Saccharibacillus sp. JS10 TaxID=2950552 RepID=UPI00210E68FA|nr:hypothetical protein [Saccharibacillus sp. JS10]MCQ4087575.1 hypothetical protein [Saccharibacillus sp. JS10]